MSVSGGERRRIHFTNSNSPPKIPLLFLSTPQNAFAPVLQPNVCVLLDVGTRPENKSIYYLWKAFDLNSNVAGACGEICADTGGKWGVGPALLNPLVAAQNFEYKVSVGEQSTSIYPFVPHLTIRTLSLDFSLDLEHSR